MVIFFKLQAHSGINLHIYNQGGDYMKYCNKCKTWRNETEFNADKRTPDGLRSTCKICYKEWAKKNRPPKNTVNKRDYIKDFNEKYKGKFEITEHVDNGNKKHKNKYKVRCLNCTSEILKSGSTIYNNTYGNRHNKCVVCEGNKELEEKIEKVKKKQQKEIKRISNRIKKYDNMILGFKECEMCNELFFTKYITTKYCEKCREEKDKDKRKSRKYIAWREAVYKRDNYTCQCCGDNTGGNLNAHHKDSYDINPKRRYEVDNGVTLCVSCPTYSLICSSVFFPYPYLL